MSPGVVLQISETVDYREDAIVSRTIVDRKSGTVTLFALADGQGLSEHTAPFNALVQIHRGRSGDHNLGQACKGQGRRIGPHATHQPHALRALTKFKMLLTMIPSLS